MRTVTLAWGSCGSCLPPDCDGGVEAEEDRSRWERPLSDRKPAFVGDSPVVDPSDDRLKKAPPLGRFRPVAPAVEECAYSPALGSGMNVGVAGREIGVGIELTVAVVLMLLRPSVDVDSRDCGLLDPEG